MPYLSCVASVFHLFQLLCVRGVYGRFRAIPASFSCTAERTFRIAKECYSFTTGQVEVPVLIRLGFVNA